MRLGTVIALAVSLWLIGCTHDPRLPSQDRDLVVSELLVFAATERGYETPAPPRVVTVASLSQVYLNAYGQDAPGLDQADAMYMPHDRTIYMHGDVDLDLVSTRGLLAHELTHYLDHINGVPYCQYFWELNATKVQVAYAARHNVTLGLDVETYVRKTYGTGCH